MSAENSTKGAVLWTIVETFANRAIGFIVQLLLARLLMPGDFAQIAMLTLFMSIGDALVDGGMTSSLIRTKDLTETDYSTVFYLNILVAFIVYCLIFFIAPYVADFYKEGELKNLLRIYAIVIVIKSFVGVQTTRMIKSMNFKKQVTIQIPSLIVGGAVGIICAKMGFKAWSLVYMSITQTLMSSIQYWLYFRWMPIRVFDSKIFKKHFNYGYKLTLTSLVNSVVGDSYNVLIGKVYTKQDLGYYNRSNVFTNLPAFLFSRTINKVTFPLFSRHQDDNVTLKKVYRKILITVTYFFTPITALMFFLADDLFKFLLTPEWAGAIPFFQILTLTSWLIPLQTHNLNIMKAKGYSSFVLKTNTIRRIFEVAGILILILIRLDIMILLWYQFSIALSIVILNTYYAGRQIKYPMHKQFWDISGTILLSFLLGLLLKLFSSNNNFTHSYLIKISIFCIIYGLCYVFISKLLKFEGFRYAKEYLNFALVKLKKIK